MFETTNQKIPRKCPQPAWQSHRLVDKLDPRGIEPDVPNEMGLVPPQNYGIKRAQR
jgi:hypothetical protein